MILCFLEMANYVLHFKGPYDFIVHTFLLKFTFLIYFVIHPIDH